MKYVKKILISFIAFVLLGLSVFSYIQTRRVDIYRSRCEYYRMELDAASSREQQLTDTVDECFESVRRTNEILSSTSNTVGDLREKLTAVRQEYENMADRLLYFYDKYHSVSDTEVNDDM